MSDFHFHLLCLACDSGESLSWFQSCRVLALTIQGRGRKQNKTFHCEDTCGGSLARPLGRVGPGVCRNPQVTVVMCTYAVSLGSKARTRQTRDNVY